VSDPDIQTWWHVEGDTGGWHMVGCRFDSLAEASEFADELRERHKISHYRVVRFQTLREVEDDA
jgi:hypothetical protein